MKLPTAAVTVAGGPARGSLAAPGSKSVTNRLLAVAALAEGESRLRDPLDSDDSRAMRRLVVALGAEVHEEAEVWRVRGTAGRVRAPAEPVDCLLSGTTLRFGAALAALAPEPVTLTGAAPLLRRPVGALTAALRALGARAEDHGGCPPVTTGGGLRGGAVTVDVARSSQFASALLLAAPYAERDVELRLSGPTARAYVELTVRTVRDWGGQVHDLAAPGGGWRVTAGRGYRGRDVDVEYDASAAAHLYALAMSSGGRVTVTNAGDSAQPDAAIVEVLAAMGGKVTRSADGVTVAGPERLRAVDVDLAAMPDQVTTVAALAALAPGTSTIRGVGVTRGHETDRLAALARELAKLGVGLEERPDGLVIHGGGARGPARLATHDDHRLAMAFAAVAAAVPGAMVEEPWCVAKTYPHFWQDLRRLGLDWREVG